MTAHEDEHRQATAEKIVDALIPELARTSPSVRTEAIAKVVEIIEDYEELRPDAPSPTRPDEV